MYKLIAIDLDGTLLNSYGIRNNHPKFPLFLKAVVGNALEEGTLVEINVTTPEGKNYCTNLKLKQEDLEFFQTLSEMGSQH